MRNFYKTQSASRVTSGSCGADEGFVVRNNGFTNTQLFVEDAAYVRIGNNTFAYPTTLGGPSGIGLFLRNAVGAQVKNNTFNNLEVGMVGEQDLTDAIFSCNTMNGCNVGWRFNGTGLTLSDQGDANNGVDNIFNSNGTNVQLVGSFTPVRYYRSNSQMINNDVFDPVDPATAPITNCSILQKNNNYSEASSFYPNPATNFIVFDVGEVEGFLEVKIFNSFGVLIYAQKITGQNVLPTSNLPNGIYTVNLFEESNGEFRIEKLVINK